MEAFESQLIVSIWLLVGLIATTALLLRRRPNMVSGVLTSRSGREYGYLLGDNLNSYRAYGRFCGIEVSLPIQMPHIYLDSVRSGGHELSTFFDPGQQLELEGDFGKYFNVFVPLQYESAALSVLSPDVMATLEDFASEFDIETFGDKLRVINNRLVLRNKVVTEHLFAVVDALLPEVEGRMRSWSEVNSSESYEQDLIIHTNAGFRLFGSYFSWFRFWFGVFWLACISGYLMLSVYLLSIGRPWLAMILGGVGITAFAVLVHMTRSKDNQLTYRSRK